MAVSSSKSVYCTCTIWIPLRVRPLSVHIPGQRRLAGRSKANAYIERNNGKYFNALLWDWERRRVCHGNLWSFGLQLLVHIAAESGGFRGLGRFFVYFALPFRVLAIVLLVRFPLADTSYSLFGLLWVAIQSRGKWLFGSLHVSLRSLRWA